MNCSYCNQPAAFVDNAVIYGRSYGRSHHAWYCRTCDAYVGVHENDPKRPLGTMANRELREWRKKAHAAIDPIWKERRMRRGQVYEWLKNYFRHDVHIGKSDVQQCAMIIAAAEKLKTELDQEDDHDEDDYSGWADGHPMDFGDR